MHQQAQAKSSRILPGDITSRSPDTARRYSVDRNGPSGRRTPIPQQGQHAASSPARRGFELTGSGDPSVLLRLTSCRILALAISASALESFITRARAARKAFRASRSAKSLLLASSRSNAAKQAREDEGRKDLQEGCVDYFSAGTRWLTGAGRVCLSQHLRPDRGGH